MWFLVIGVFMLGLRFSGVPPVAVWAWETHWWAFAVPFAAAALWWTLADYTGWTSRQAMAKQDAMRQARRERHFEALGKPSPGQRRSRRA